MKSFKVHQHNRRGLQLFTLLGLPLVVVAGWFAPLLGFLLFGCMAGALGVAAFKGRAWCDWMCPRGAFFDVVLKKRKHKEGSIPSFLRSPITRGFMVAVLMGVMGTQIYLNWGDIPAIGRALVMLLTVTTGVGIVLGLFFRERAWCWICPMGTISNLISTGKKPLSIEKDACVSCKACAKVCPMELKPASHVKAGVVAENDCIKCGGCVAICPKDALSFSRKAA